MMRASKKPVPRKSLSALGMLALVACAAGPGGGCGEQQDPSPDRSPFRDSWEAVADQAFEHTASDGTPQIFQLTIGGREDNDNFANRGDIIVNFDGPANRILIEMRRFTFNTNEDAAQTDFDDLSLWAYTTAPAKPQSQDPADDCVASGWQNDCEVRVYFDGQAQLKRSGADFRVTLPADYRYGINVVTQDNVEEEDYLNRGNVCISNLFASATVEVESGKVWTTLAREVTPAPTCSAEEIEACETWTVEDDMGNVTPAPWAPECDCIAVNGVFGRVDIKSREETAADITVDMPSGLWASVKAENTGMGQEASGEHCDATIEVADFVPNETGNDSPWEKFGNTNFPGEPAIAGAGFSVVASSKSCEPVAFTEDPEDFVGVGKGEEQSSEERGNVRICTDCITQSCNDLIP
jgi:hypothetical protein